MYYITIYIFVLLFVLPSWICGPVHLVSEIDFAQILCCLLTFLLLFNRDYKFNTSYAKKHWLLHYIFIYIIFYISLQIINSAGDINAITESLEYNEFYIRFIPYSYNKTASIAGIVKLISCVMFLYSFVFLISPYITKQSIVEPIFFNVVMFGGILALVAIIQREVGTDKIAFVYENQIKNMDHTLGPFGYRTNGVSFLNIILCLGLGFLLDMCRQVNITKSKYLLLLPSTLCIIYACLTSFSRSGSIMTIIIIMTFLFKLFREQKQRHKTIWLVSLVLLILGFKIVSKDQIKHLFDRFSLNTFTIENNNNNVYNNFVIGLDFDFLYNEINQDVKIIGFANSYNYKYKVNEVYLTLKKDGTLELKIKDKNREYIGHIIGFVESIKVNNYIELYCNSKGAYLKTKDSNKIIYFSDTLKQFGNVWEFKFDEIQLSNITNHSEILSVNKATIKVIDDNKYVKIYDYDSYPISFIFSKIAESRKRIYHNTINMLTDNFMFGFGYQSWPYVYKLYKDVDEVAEFWCHCDPLQFLLELGVLGSFVIICLFIYLLKLPLNITHFKNFSNSFFALKFMLVITVIHSFVDFPFQVYVINLLICGLVGLLLLMSRPPKLYRNGCN